MLDSKQELFELLFTRLMTKTSHSVMRLIALPLATLITNLSQTRNEEHLSNLLENGLLDACFFLLSKQKEHRQCTLTCLQIIQGFLALTSDEGNDSNETISYLVSDKIDSPINILKDANDRAVTTGYDVLEGLRFHHSSDPDVINMLDEIQQFLQGDMDSEEDNDYQ